MSPPEMDRLPLHPTRACQECNRKKVKCDMKRPVCGLCQRTGNDCSFPLRRKAPSTAASKSKTKTKSQNLGDSLDRLLNFIEANKQAGLQNGDRSIVNWLSSRGDLTPRTDNEEGTTLPVNRDMEPQVADETSRLEPIPQILQDMVWDEMDFTPFTRASTARERPASQSDQGMQQPQWSSLPVEPVSYDMAMNLIDTFFDHIQQWLPLLHKPRFRARYAEHLGAGPNALEHLPVDELLLLNSLFALSARFSTSPMFTNVEPLERGSRFLPGARKAYAEARSMENPTLTYLQGCILMAFYYYTSELSSQGWILIGVCTRLMYELGLSEIDSTSFARLQYADSVEKEEMRRAWWLVWELDTFGSTVYRRPYAVDRHRQTVMLPVSDDVWFNDEEWQSSRLLTYPDQCWRSLRGCKNQDPRAWYLIANHIMSIANDYLQRNHGVSLKEKIAMDNGISCLKLSLPAIFNISTEVLVSDSTTFARNNWIIGTHLMLMAASCMSDLILVNEEDEASPPMQESRGTLSAVRTRACELSRIVARWPVDYISTAHPFWACMMLPIYIPERGSAIYKSLLSSSQNLAELVLERFAGKWKLSSTILRLSKMINESAETTPEDPQFAKRFAIYFPPSMTAVDPASAASTENGKGQQTGSGFYHEDYQNQNQNREPSSLLNLSTTMSNLFDQQPNPPQLLEQNEGIEMPALDGQMNVFLPDNQAREIMHHRDYLNSYLPEVSDDFLRTWVAMR